METIVGLDYHIPPKNVGKSSETEAIIIIILPNIFWGENKVS